MSQNGHDHGHGKDLLVFSPIFAIAMKRAHAQQPLSQNAADEET